MKNTKVEKVRVLLAEPKNAEHFANEKALLATDEVELVASVSDGLETLEILNENKIDLLLLDFLVTGIDGISVLREINKMESVPVTVMVTPISSEMLINEAAVLGVVYSLTKPFVSDIAMKRALEIYHGMQELCSEFIDKPEDMGRLRHAIVEFLRLAGTPPHLLGHKYLAAAIEYSVQNEGFGQNVTTQLYPYIAEKFGSSPQKVERSTRHAIEFTWNKNSGKSIRSAFGMEETAEMVRPTNSEFIAMSTNVIMDKISKDSWI